MHQVGIACIGEEPPPHMVEKARKFLEALVGMCGRNLVLFLGGYWGLMKVVVDEALRNNIKVVLILPIGKEICPPEAICVRTGLEFKARSIALVRSVDVLVVLGGASGTLLELVAAYAMGIPVVVLTSTGYPTDKIPLTYGEYLDHRKTTKIYYYEDPISVARRTCELLHGEGK